MSRYRSAFTSRLREAMLDKGLRARRGNATGVDIQALKRAAGVTNEMARRYVAGESLPDIDRMSQIADWLEVSLPWLRDGVPTQEKVFADNLSKKEKELITNFRSCTAKGRLFILQCSEITLKSEQLTKSV